MEISYLLRGALKIVTGSLVSVGPSVLGNTVVGNMVLENSVLGSTVAWQGKDGVPHRNDLMTEVLHSSPNGYQGFQSPR